MSSLRPIIPPDLLRQISKSSKVSLRVRNGAQNTLRQMAAVRAIRRDTLTQNVANAGSPRRHAAAETSAVGDPPPRRTIYHCHGRPALPFDVNRDGVFDLIPPYPLFSGTPLLTEGHVFTGSEDPNATTLYHNLKRVYDFYKVVFERDSVDGEGLKLVGCVHFDDDATTPGFQNAWWFHGLAVFGDGDGEVFRSFGDFLDLTAHELTHGVVETTAMLKYENQAGALNESLADVFASMVKQWSKSPQQKAREADWLIGRGLFMVPDARALRDLANPGTAYGTAGLFDISDPQPQDMDGYVEIYPPDGDPNTGNDSGGVHLYSGIPNRAFYLVATTLGGYSWDVAGRIWYDAMRDVDLRSVDPRTAFKSFANLTVKHAQRHGTAAVDAVNAAWTAVKVFPRSHL